MDSSFSRKRVKIAGAVVAAALLVVVGVVALNNATVDAPLMPLEHAQALARAENTNTPMSQLPDESAISTPNGWQIETDEPVAGAAEEPADEDLEQESEPFDEDIDSPVMVEEDEEGNKFVAEMEEDVLSDSDNEEEDEANNEEGMDVAEDKKKRPLRCKNRRLKKCGFKRACRKICKRKCRRVIKRKCKTRKFCRCFCKFRKNKKAARRCVLYKRKICKPVGVTLCKRGCRKFCRRLRHCYCCKGRRQVRRQCRRTCRREIQKTPCARCRCRKLKCYRSCIMVCKK